MTLETPDWKKFAALTGDRPVEFERSSSGLSSIKTNEPRPSDPSPSSASLYREIIEADVAITEHSNAQFLARIHKTKRRTQAKTISAHKRLRGDTDELPAVELVECEMCKMEIPAAEVDNHRTTTCHLLARGEIEGRGEQPMIYAFSEKDVGYRMLKKQGWAHGGVLGAGDETVGRSLQTPIAPKIKRDKGGLGTVAKKNSSAGLTRVGDSFRKPVVDQIESLEKHKKLYREGNGVVKKSHQQIVKDASKERAKGIALLAYLND
ncbi:hypothetical protein HDU98_011153 [Podochytrium sp. JEL0797]|nr:hypothetical protein HDU98_011153 [Podochytrium sp. JEL0797]